MSICYIESITYIQCTGEYTTTRAHLTFCVQGNPFCLQTGYMAAVQQQLPNLQHFDSSPISFQPNHAKTSNPGPASTDAGLNPASPFTAPQSQPACNTRQGQQPAEATNRVKSPPLTAKVQSRPVSRADPVAQQAKEADSIAAWQPTLPGDSVAPLQLQVQLSQLTVNRTTPADSVPAVENASVAAQPPLYNYYLQLRWVTVIRSLLSCQASLFVCLRVCLLVDLSVRGSACLLTCLAPSGRYQS